MIYILISVLIFVFLAALGCFLYEMNQQEKNKSHREYYLFLDDERSIPLKLLTPGTCWVVCRSSQEAIDYVERNGAPKFASFDHDLGGSDTTMTFLKWIANDYKKGRCIPFGYIVHSENPVGKNNIISFMESWKKSQNI